MANSAYELPAFSGLCGFQQTGTDLARESGIYHIFHLRKLTIIQLADPKLHDAKRQVPLRMDGRHLQIPSRRNHDRLQHAISLATSFI